jgi:hypothetical protein
MRRFRLRYVASPEVQVLAAAGAVLRLRQGEPSARSTSQETLEKFVQLTLPNTMTV